MQMTNIRGGLVIVRYCWAGPPSVQVGYGSRKQWGSGRISVRFA